MALFLYLCGAFYFFAKEWTDERDSMLAAIVCALLWFIIVTLVTIIYIVLTLKIEYGFFRKWSLTKGKK